MDGWRHGVAGYGVDRGVVGQGGGGGLGSVGERWGGLVDMGLGGELG